MNYGQQPSNYSIAKQRANWFAQNQYRYGHPRGEFSQAGARFEGVGYSSKGAQQAINKARYSGHSDSAKGPGKPRLAQARTQGSDGFWYAVILLN